MSVVLDLLWHGFRQASGLSITSDGLLVIRQDTVAEAADEDVRFASGLRVDARLRFDPLTLEADLAIRDGDLEGDRGLETALILSLFNDARCSVEELQRFGGEDRRGWWANTLAEIDDDEWGSKLWLLSREKQTPQTLLRAREYAQDALQWMVDDGIADAVNVEAVYPRRALLGLGVEIVRAKRPRERFAFVWEQ